MQIRLICVRTKTLKLKLMNPTTTKYAILSHTWSDGGREEVSFSDFHKSKKRQQKKGFSKILSACAQARKDRLKYLWVDSCCIDKTNKEEHDASIRSMFEWYRRAEKCYAFLEDVSSSNPGNAFDLRSPFAKSRWFTRGWTLQELIAPPEVLFFNKYWSKIGDREQLAPQLELITNIDAEVLEGGSFHRISIGRRMSWASNRQTTRDEDIAYCLMGIFSINMDTRYGEGSRAFIRLQEEILKRSDDQTLLAWRRTDIPTLSTIASGLLAESPRDFANFRGELTPKVPQDGKSGLGDVISSTPKEYASASSYSLTNRGIRIVSAAKDISSQRPGETILLALNCSYGPGSSNRVGIYLQRFRGNQYFRILPWELGVCASRGLPQKTVYGTGPSTGKLNYQQPDYYTWRPFREAAMGGSAPGNDYQHALYIGNLVIDVGWDKYFPSSVICLDPYRRIPRHIIFPAEARRYRDIAFRTYWENRKSEFRMSIIWRARNGSDALLVMLGTDWDKGGSGFSYWFDALSIPNKIANCSDTVSALYDFVTGTGKPKITSTFQKHVSVGRERNLLVSVTQKQVRGLNIFALEVSGSQFRKTGWSEPTK